jgi:prepilin-type N-terminal cleavage/methylation domain-containing protein
LRRSPMNAEAGFTLIEVLIALALLTVIAFLLVNAVGSARQALNVVGLRVMQASVPAVQSVLRRLLLEARPNLDGVRHVDPDRAFFGEPNKLRFVSSFVPQGQYGGLWRYEIALEAGEGATALVLTQQLIRPASSAVGTTAPHRCPQGDARFQRALLRRRGQRESPAMTRYLATFPTACRVSFPRTPRLLDLDHGQRWS